ncbi:MAG: TIGR01777 family oxidoreductase [Hyphomicrobium sp.]|nr:TIGR01777 family oxidoreductase [Hyphomicrobium sp.]
MSQEILSSPFLWTLVSFQLFMGAFDVVFHHELTERLAWRAGAANELKLHAARNFFYGVLFAVFAWVEPHGLLAWLLVVVLAIEIVITLADFVEEDLTRKLPATERVLHTLLAINYGAIMALVAPALIDWTSAPTGFALVSYGMGSWVLTLASIGVVAFGLRDIATSRRLGRLVVPNPVEISDILPARNAVLVTGGTGFVGQQLVEALASAGHDVTAVVRTMANAPRLATPVRIVSSLDEIPAESRIDAIVDLAGEPVAGGLWTKRRRFAIVASRIRSARAIERLVARLDAKPAVLVKASAVGRYGTRDDEMLTEADDGASRKEFAVRSCLATEAAALRAGRQFGLRVVNLRIGLVLGRDGGVLARMLPAFDLALGGPFGSGRQWMSWIALSDLVRLIVFAIANPSLEGAVNATAPAPVRNAAFARALGAALGRPAVFVVPSALLGLIGGGLARELLLGGQRVLPAKALASGFVFGKPTLAAALAAELATDYRERVREGRSPLETPRSGTTPDASVPLRPV